MFSKNELQNIISGIGGGPESHFIQAAANYLRTCTQTGRATQENKQPKETEEQSLISWISDNNFWFDDIDEARYLTRGAEQRVYLYQNTTHVLKLNDAIFYSNWTDYFHSLLTHNYFFPNTAYELLGFCLYESVFHAVVKQPYVTITSPTDLDKVKDFLLTNGFRVIRNNDYVHDEWGIILEDLHDENVLTNSGILFFIDTVFFLDWRI